MIYWKSYDFIKDIALSIIDPIAHSNKILSYFAIIQIGRYINSLKVKVEYLGILIS